MSENHIEKTFLYLVALSVFLHVAIYALILSYPQKRQEPPAEPYMVELQDLPPVMAPAPREKQVRRHDEERRRVPVETAPRGEMEREKPSGARPILPRVIPQVAGEREAPPRPAEAPSRPVENEAAPLEEKPRGGDFFKQKNTLVPDVASLYPSADKLARLEDGYRKKYGPEVAEGETKFLNTDDLQFGSFLRRFESAVYGVWRYPSEAAKLGIEGITPVKITFNRKGEIEKVDILDEGSGSRILDEEVRRTLKMVGPIGGFPKRYDKEYFNLVAFFHYGIVRGRIRGTLY